MNASAGDGIYFYGWLEYLANTTVELGVVNISENDIISSGDGIFADWWDIMHLSGSTTVTAERSFVDDNVIDAGGDGIYYLFDYVGYDMSGDSSVLIRDVSIYDNVIDASSDGVYVEFTEFGMTPSVRPLRNTRKAFPSPFR